MINDSPVGTLIRTRKTLIWCDKRTDDHLGGTLLKATAYVIGENNDPTKDLLEDECAIVEGTLCNIVGIIPTPHAIEERLYDALVVDKDAPEAIRGKTLRLYRDEFIPLSPLEQLASVADHRTES